MATGAIAAHAEAAVHPARHGTDIQLSTAQIARRTSFTDKALSAASQAGLVNNLSGRRRLRSRNSEFDVFGGFLIACERR